MVWSQNAKGYITVIGAPLSALFCYPHPSWTYMQRVVYCGLRGLMKLEPMRLRGTLGFFGKMQGFLYRPQRVLLPNISGSWYGDEEAKNKDEQVVFLYCHGGGFTTGSADYSSLVFLKPLLAQMQDHGVSCRVFSLEYGLAPAHQHPTQLHQCKEAYAWLLEQGIPSHKICLIGDSAGASMLLLTLRSLRNDRDARGDIALPLPAGAIRISPWLDLSMSKDSWERNMPTDYLRREPTHELLDCYFPATMDRQQVTASMSAGLKSAENLSPLMVVYSKGECFCDEIEAFVDRAKSANVDVVVHSHPSMFHIYCLFPVGKPQQEALQAMAAFARAKCLVPLELSK